MLERDFDVTEVPDGQLASFELSNRYAESGYDLASVTHSNVDGIPTVRFTYLKSNVQLSRTVDNESPLLTEVREYLIQMHPRKVYLDTLYLIKRIRCRRYTY